jgi:hypothetical protein
MVAQTYFCTLTAVGEAKDANAKALGIALKFTEMALGDGNGALPIPDRTRTSLVRQVRRGAINSMKADLANPGQVIIEQVIPETEGGWWIRELGVYDSDGDLVAIGNCPETYKPQLAEGSGRTQVVRMVLIMSSAATVTLKVDPSVVLATRKYVDDQDALHVAALDPHPQYLTKTDGAAKIAAAVAALVNASPTTLDTLAELAAALGNDKDFAANVMNALALKASLASPALTGTPTAPTPAQFDNSTKLATMAALKRQGLQASGNRSIAAAGNILPSDAGATLNLAGNPGVVFLPSASSVPAGSIFVIFPQGSGWIISTVNSEAINFGGGNVVNRALNGGDTLVLESDGGASWLVIGGMAAVKMSLLFGASLAASGYQKLPSGLIIQWGAIVSQAANTSTVFNLPIAFPNGIAAAFSSLINSVGNAYISTVYSANAANVTVGSNYPGQAQNFIFAIGF